MNMKTRGIIASFSVLLLCGCGKAHNPPPLERGAMVERFFVSAQSGNYSAAIQLGKKLQLEQEHYNFMRELTAVMESNEALRVVQEKIDRGDIKGALQDVERGIAAYPHNRTLPPLRNRLRQLSNAPKLLRAMRKAQSSSSMRAALTAAEVGLAETLTPELKKYFFAYNEQIILATRRELQAAQETGRSPVPAPHP